MKKNLLFAFLFLSSIYIFAQDDFTIGQWRSHFPYGKLKSVATDNKGTVYAASEYAAFSYDIETGVISIMSKINQLSDIGISCIKYNYTYDFLFIAYSNSNIDIIKDGRTINISDIYRSNIIGRKSINNIYFLNKYAYLSCGFGVVVVDIEKFEIADTYFIGDKGEYINVNDFTYWEKENLFVASTIGGLYFAENKDNINLSFYENWTKITDYPTVSDSINFIATFADKLFVNVYSLKDDQDTLLYYDGRVWSNFSEESLSRIYNIDITNNKLVLSFFSGSKTYDTDFNLILHSWKYTNSSARPRQTVIDNNGTYWVADNNSGLVYFKEGWEGTSIVPSGPSISEVFNIVSDNDKIFIFAGGYNASWVPSYKSSNFSVFDSKDWVAVNGSVIPGLNNYSDIVDIAVDPRNDNHYFLASYSYGLIEVLNNEIVNVYNNSNSTISDRVGGVKYDDNNNLWISNSLSNKAVQVLMANGSWGNISLAPDFASVEISKITIDKHGQKWMKTRHAGTIYIVNDNGTPEYAGDDKSKKITTSIGSGNIPGQSVYAITCDKTGKVWIGTDMGVAVFHYPEKVFSGENFDASQILVETDEDVRPLLESETVTAICVDHGNNKWFGTSSSGIYYTSEDGKTELAHFTKENSPLLSNSITNIEINSKGEVFIATESGICSFLGSSSEPQPTYDKIFAYPNPVRPEYDGPIAVTGLKENTFVKIVDTAGKIVYSDISNGGQVVWNGYTPSGKKAASGVYVVFVVDSYGEEKASTKILIIR